MPWINCLGGDRSSGKNRGAKQLISVSQPINLLIKVRNIKLLLLYIFNYFLITFINIICYIMNYYIPSAVDMKFLYYRLENFAARS